VATACYTADAAVTDEGRTHRGAAEIHAWLATSAAEYTYTSELTTAASAACAVSPTLWALVAFRCVQAAGTAILVPSSLGLYQTRRTAC
jgi:MFS family permease